MARQNFPGFLKIECVINTFLKFHQQFVKSTSKHSLITYHPCHFAIVWNNRIDLQNKATKIFVFKQFGEYIIFTVMKSLGNTSYVSN